MIVRSTLLAFCILVMLTISALLLSGRVSATKQNAVARTATSRTMHSPHAARARVMSRSAGGASAAVSEQTMTDSEETANEIASVLKPDASRGTANNSKLAFSSPSDKGAQEQQQIRSEPEEVPMIGPVSQDQDLRDLPDIPQVENEADQRLTRHPPSTNPGQGQSVSDPLQPLRLSAQAVTMPTPSATFAGITSAQSACGCLPPDTDGDVGSNYYIQAVNSRLKIIDKAGNQLLAPTTYNSFFSALGTSTPCGNNQNDGDAVVFYDHVANRWVVSDFAFPAFPGTAFYQCIGVSKTPDPVSGGWWLYALQVDPSNTNYLGDYPKFGVWSDGYYMAVNLFSNNTTFNGVRVYALPRKQLINGTGAPTPAAIAFTIDPTTLGDAYSLLPATFRTGSPPPTGEAEYFMAINSSSTAGTVENQVFTWRFHADFANPANSTFGVGANHAPDATVTVNGFVDAFQATPGTLIVPQTGTIRLLDTLGDKLMYPLVYQNLNGVESIYAAHTVNNNQNGTGPTAIRWYQFNVTGNTVPATPAQQQTFNNNADGLWRFMPSINVDNQGNLSIGYSESSSTTNPAIAYAGRLTNDTQSTLAQGEATLIAGAGHQTSSSGRWGDYSATFVDPQDGCTFWHTNEYYSASSTSSWNTRIGNFKYSQCAPTCVSVPHIKTSDFDGGVKSNVIVWQGNTTGQWILLDDTNAQQVLATWGGASLGDVAVPGDYDGDGKTDIAVWRAGEGNWYVLKSTGGVSVQGWGASTDIPVPGDYDGDGKTDIAVYRPSEGNWYILKSTGGLSVQGWGTSGDKPVPGDYDNDGLTDVAVYRPSEGNWYVKKSTGGLMIQNWGNASDELVPADYDGDGRTDFAVFRPSEGNWYIINSCSHTATIRGWGVSSDRPVPADFDGDGKADIAVWRPSEGNWYIINSSTNGLQIRNLGNATDTPVAYAYLPQ
jgi:hypothetical protein